MAENATLNVPINAYARSAGGQEGSGQAQVFAPYDSTKFDKARVAADQRTQKQNAKALKDARAYKAPDFEELTTPWEYDSKLYSDELHKLEKDELENELAYYDIRIKYKNHPEKMYEEQTKNSLQTARINSRYRELEDKVQMGLVNKAIYTSAQNAANDPNYSKNFDSKASDRRKTEFANLSSDDPERQEYLNSLIEKRGVQGARNFLLNNEDEYGGSLLKQKFNYGSYQKERYAINAGLGTETVTSGVGKNVDKGLLYKSKTTNKFYDLGEIMDGEINSLRNYDTYQEWIVDNSRFSDELKEKYPNVELTNLTSNQIVGWAKDSPEFQKMVKTEFMPRDVEKYEISATELKSGSMGSKVIPNDAPLEKTNLQTLFSTISFNVPQINFIYGDVEAPLTKLGKVVGIDPQQFSPQDQKSKNATIGAGVNMTVYNAYTGEDITELVDVGAFEEDGQGFVVNTFWATRDFTYKNADGKLVKVKAGDELPEESMGGLKPLYDYTTKRRYNTTTEGQTNVDGTNKNLQVVVVQDASGYTNQTDSASNIQWENDKRVRRDAYSKTTVNGENGASWVEDRAINFYGADTPANWNKAEADATATLQGKQIPTQSTGVIRGTSR